MTIKESIRTIILFLLTLEAKAVLKRHAPKIIAVTGSVGKTSTKDAAYTALKGSTFVRKSEKTYNTDIGVPLTILGLPNGWSNLLTWVQNLLRGFILIFSGTPYPKLLVIEIGADRPGDISKSLSWVKPHIVITTTFPDVPPHVEFYASSKAVVEEEMFPLTLLKSGGVAVMNFDDKHTQETELGAGVEKVTYGFQKGADVRALRYRVTSKQGKVTGISFDISYLDKTAHIIVPGIVGKNHVYAILAGAAGALGAGTTFEVATNGFSNHKAPPGRLSLLEGKGGAVIIDDSYNSSPEAVERALEALAVAPTKGKRVAVLGDMFELGVFSSEEHVRIGALAHEKSDILVTVGVRARAMANKAREVGMPESRVHSFEKNDQAINFLSQFIEEGDIVLVKGSQGMRMERVVKALMAESEKASEMLVRQNSEWLAR